MQKKTGDQPNTMQTYYGIYNVHCKTWKQYKKRKDSSTNSGSHFHTKNTKNFLVKVAWNPKPKNYLNNIQLH